MFDFERTGLWKRILAKRDSDPDAAARERLLAQLLLLRERAGNVARDIQRALPSVSTQGVASFGALWERAELLLGEDYPLNPAEAFVLGGAFLVHGLGSGLAVHPGGEAELRATVAWRDALAARIRRETDREPTPAELENPPAELTRLATQEALHILHAKQAETLALVTRKGPHGEQQHLIEDEVLREHCGRLLGQIAHSQGWEVEEVGRVFSARTLAAPAFAPQGWKVDALKVALALRAVWASLLDKHYRRLAAPTLVHDRLCYTSAEPFGRGEAESFWYCFDVLRRVDRELHEVDALLVASGRPRFRARGVVGIEDAMRLSVHVRTEGWAPVDARIHVSEVPSLLAQLGGTQLYGDDPTVPLRELIQNAADAVRARRALQGLAEDWGNITIRVGHDANGRWIEVEDTGIGMSERVLSRHLLDFGKSYWMTEDMRREHPGLASSGFVPTGRFGIGFFSVFMWGERLSVISRPCVPEGVTRVLEFNQGLGARPLLRPAGPGEQLSDGGTRVRVWLAQEKSWEKMLLDRFHHWTDGEEEVGFGELLGRMAPMLDVTLRLEDRPGHFTTVVEANDWVTLDAARLLRRIGNTTRRLNTAMLEFLAPMVRPVLDANGKYVGRICIAAGAMKRWAGFGVITAGGLRARYAQEFTGALLGTTDVATRDDAEPLALREDLARWASEQARLWAKYQLNFEGYELEKRHDVGLAVLACGGDPGELPIGFRSGVPITLSTLQEFVAERESVTIVDGAERPLRKHPEVVAIPCHEAGHATAGRLLVHLPELLGGFLARAWGAPIQEVVANVQVSEKEWGTVDGRKWRTWVFQRPPASSRIH